MLAHATEGIAVAATRAVARGARIRSKWPNQTKWSLFRSLHATSAALNHAIPQRYTWHASCFLLRQEASNETIELRAPMDLVRARIHAALWSPPLLLQRRCHPSLCYPWYYVGGAVCGASIQLLREPWDWSSADLEHLVRLDHRPCAYPLLGSPDTTALPGRPCSSGVRRRPSRQATPWQGFLTSTTSFGTRGR